MNSEERHPTEELQLLLDQRLASEQQAAVRSHLRDCARCLQEFTALTEVRDALRRRLQDRALPNGLAARVSAALADQPRPTEAPRRLPNRRRVLAWGVSIAAVLLLGLLAGVLLRRSARADAVEMVASDYRALRSGRLGLEVETQDPGTLERHFARSGLPFATRVFDLRMMGHALAGGRVHRLGSVPSALFVYRGAQGDLVVCQMYEGRLEALRPASEERTHNGVRFRVYRAGDLTLVFWQEGNVICVLAAAGDPESAVQLAFAKAAKA